MTQHEQRLQRALQSCAEQAIPDTLDLWPRLRAQATAPQPARWRSPVGSLRLQRVPIILLLLLLVAGVGCATGAAIRQAFFARDRGLEEAVQAGLIHEVNQSQTIDGVMVTIQRAYLDARRLAIGLTVRGAKGDSYFLHHRGDLLLNGVPMQGLISIGGSGDWQIINDDRVATDEKGFEYDVHAFDAVSPAIAQLTQRAPGSPPALVTVDVGIEVIDSIEDDADVFGPIGPFHFRFAVPIQPSRQIDLQHTQQAAGIAVTLEEVLITPSLIEARLCFDPQAPGEGWTPHIMVQRPDGWQINSKHAVTDPAGCRTAQLSGVGTDQSGTWTVQVNRVQSETDTVTGPWTFTFTVPEQ